ncbi:MAG: YicC/YloC family endoribonuclease [Gammaproteobacteria bacterium]
MIRSMTGFARAAREGEWGELALELRSVNHRYLDLKLILPDMLRPLEEMLRTRLRAGLARGRVEAALRWRARGGARIQVDHALAGEVADAARGLAAEAGVEGAPIPDAMALLAWPGVIQAPNPELERLSPEVEVLCEEALAALVAAREREGTALAEVLSRRLLNLIADAEHLLTQAPEKAADLRVRLAARLEALGTEVDAARVAQEAAILVVRQDVSEELDRLLAHAREAVRLLDAETAVGRRLDFLMQELAREANTLASKAGDLAVNRMALDFKVLIEEMREQVQNVE